MVRTVFQTLAALLGWVIFGLLWWVAFRYSTFSRDLVDGLVLTVGLAVIAGEAAAVWVVRSVYVWLKKGPPPVRLPHPHNYWRDATGRAVQADFPGLRSSRYVVIDVIESPGSRRKTYEAGDEAVTAEEAVACNQ